MKTFFGMTALAAMVSTAAVAQDPRCTLPPELEGTHEISYNAESDLCEARPIEGTGAAVDSPLLGGLSGTTGIILGVTALGIILLAADSTTGT